MHINLSADTAKGILAGVPDQLRALIDAGVQLGQGYLLGYPGPLPSSGTWPTWGDASTLMEPDAIAVND